jgi:hypothetical protein
VGPQGRCQGPQAAAIPWSAAHRCDMLCWLCQQQIKVFYAVASTTCPVRLQCMCRNRRPHKPPGCIPCKQLRDCLTEQLPVTTITQQTMRGQQHGSGRSTGHKRMLLPLTCLCTADCATGSLDRTIRLWDLTYGMPLSISRPHGGTVRAVALDHALVASGKQQQSPLKAKYNKSLVSSVVAI